MAIIDQNSQPFQPYARLMNIIGDQLITDKKVAVIEIIKNSYDADSEIVKVNFFNMDKYGQDYLPIEEQPYIEIEDEGDGMSLETIKNIWLRPATPSKLDKKKRKINVTKKGRIIQGEKGVGRFALHKLGERIELYTKAFQDNEIKLVMDFTEYNPEKVNLFKQNSDYKLLNEVQNHWYVNDKPEVIKTEKGTLIRIFQLREKWNEKHYEDLYKSIQRLIPPVDENAKSLGIDFKQDFEIKMFIDNKLYTTEEATTFQDVIDNAQYTIIGSVSHDGVLSFNYNSTFPERKIKRKINLLDIEELAKYNYALYSIDKWFNKYNREPLCGSFHFTFYAYDLSKPNKEILTKDIKQFIKDNFVFVLRDGVRVYPYGEKGIDWLNLDKLRSTYKAGQFISYNDLTGFVYISQKENELLRDSTNRQGLMDIDNAYEDFINLVTAVTEIFNCEIKIDKSKEKLHKSKPFKSSKENYLLSYNSLKTNLEKMNEFTTLEKANKFLKDIEKHDKVLSERMITVEDLAGLGMAVEKASHDAITVLSILRNNVYDIKTKFKKNELTENEIIDFLEELDENLHFIYEEMQIIQPLFKNQRGKIINVNVLESIQKVIKYFRRDIDKKIRVDVICDKEIIVRTNKGLILQIFINLIDNAIYWMKYNKNEKNIIIKLQKNNTVIISDNGPGIRNDIESLVFQEFFSTKGDGRGLGLYIVKELLFRINSEIGIIHDEKKKLLPGANFIIKFNEDK
ncbi:MAG: ATP-binding protein [Spirochaetes bacterium]|nr:ATP-binding protein [Spirochaetota bacterium]